MTFWIFIRTQRIAEQYIIIRSDQTRPFETRPTEKCWLTRYSHITKINMWILLAFIRRINECLSCVSFYANLNVFLVMIQYNFYLKLCIDLYTTFRHTKEAKICIPVRRCNCAFSQYKWKYFLNVLGKATTAKLDSHFILLAIL
jgi:hypothetical protein